MPFSLHLLQLLLLNIILQQMTRFFLKRNIKKYLILPNKTKRLLIMWMFWQQRAAASRPELEMKPDPVRTGSAADANSPRLFFPRSRLHQMIFSV